MLADPLVVIRDWSVITAAAGDNVSMPVLERDSDHSTYGWDNLTSPNYEKWRLFVGHQYGKRSRYTARLTVSGITPQLLLDGSNTTFTQSCYVVFDAPQTGYLDISESGESTPNRMLKVIGGLLVSVDTADPVFKRVLAGET